MATTTQIIFYADSAGVTTASSTFIGPATTDPKAQSSAAVGTPPSPSSPQNPATVATPSTAIPATTKNEDAQSAVFSSPSVSSKGGQPTSMAQSSDASQGPQTSVNGTQQIHLHDNQCENCLSAGPIAGIAIGVAILAGILAFLVAFFALRKRRRPNHHNAPEQTYLNGNRDNLELNSVPGKGIAASTLDERLPQPADDKTVQTKVESMLDQVQLFVENFIQDEANPQVRVSAADISPLDSSSLTKPLATILPTTSDSMSLIKHTLVNYIVGLISTSSAPDRSLLPPDLSLLPYKVNTGARNAKSTPDLHPYLSRWRALTAYLRLNTTDDSIYAAQRDAKISNSNAIVLRAFGPWLKPRYTAKDHVNSLTTILREAAALGAFIASQPADLQFRWPNVNESGAGRIAVTPSLIKSTDELGRTLRQPQTVVSPKFVKVRGVI